MHFNININKKRIYSMLKKLTPNLIVDDVQETIDFYQNMLGCFELISRDPEKGDLGWALMRCEDVEIMFQSKKSLKDFIPDFMNENRGGNIIILYLRLIISTVSMIG
ncbi:MAG: hypothetical protein U5N58_07520 [Actinomycetota bacterium]|nr:hypothetical protein [Actinomycetota bacterium]